MPQYAMLMSTPCFYYSGREDFDNLRDYLADLTGTAPRLNADGSVYYYSGFGSYSTLHPGEWLVRLSAPQSNETMREMYAPAEAWPNGFPAGPQ